MEQARTIGRAARPVEFEVLGEMTALDLSLLDEEKGSKSPAIARLSARHHALARHIAEGKKIGEAAAICGYNISRVSILQDDPSFKALVDFYRKDLEQVYLGTHELLAQASKTAALEILERLEDDPKKVKYDELLETVKMGADRTGHGPSSSQQVNLNIGIGDRLEAARKRIAARMIDVTPNQEAAE